MKGDLAGDIFAALADAPEGMTVYQLADVTEAAVPRVRKALRTTRLILGENDSLWVTCEPQGQRKPWLYKLVGGGTLVDPEQNMSWTANRVGDAQSRIHTIRMGMEAAVRDLDRRTVLGRKAVTIERGLRHLEEDLEAIDFVGE